MVFLWRYDFVNLARDPGHTSQILPSRTPRALVKIQVPGPYPRMNEWVQVLDTDAEPGLSLHSGDRAVGEILSLSHIFSLAPVLDVGRRGGQNRMPLERRRFLPFPADIREGSL